MYAGPMNLIEGYAVEPLTTERFDDLELILGRGGISGCWCMYWTIPTTTLWSKGAKGGSTAPNRAAFLAIVDAGPPPGMIVYADGEPAGWCRVMRRTDLPGLANSRHFRTDLEIDNVWSLPCFVVRKQFRGRGLTTVLVKAAIGHVSSQGGGILEAYPWDTSDRKAPSTVYTGLAATFERLGFEVVQRLVPHKPMMRLIID